MNYFGARYLDPMLGLRTSAVELDYSNLYEPNGNVEFGEIICATCSD